jgi:transcriptional regulator GlxA family with amidase domain
MTFDPANDLSGEGSFRAVATRAAAYMRAHLDEPLTTSRIAKALGVSARTLHRAVRACGGVSPRMMLASMRIAQAQRLLGEGVKVEAVAMSVGFRSRVSLHRLFRKLARCAPTDCRSEQGAAAADGFDSGTVLAGGGQE